MSLFTVGQRVHIVAVGGAGMSAIARILMAKGCIVSGSDVAASTRLSALQAEGVDAYVGHDAQAFVLRNPDALIHSTAIKDDNTEMQAAQAAGLPILSRADALVELLRERDVIEVVGTHGKTTTASMLAVCAIELGLDPSYLVGSEIAQTQTNARWAAPLMVVEGDESDASGFRLHPRVLIVTNVEADHLDFWHTEDELDAAFAQFAATVPDDGAIVVCADDEGARKVGAAAQLAGRRVVTYGSSADADVRMVELGFGSRGPRVRIEGAITHEQVELQVPGLHNLRNALAVMTTGHVLGWDPSKTAEALRGFQSTRRRFETIATVEGVEVIDDYAHHPTAVAATIDAAQRIAHSRREAGDPARVIAVCQPYRWYRTAANTTEYAVALDLADEVVLLDVYGPGETPIPGAGPKAIATLMHTSQQYVPSKEAAVALLTAMSRSGDIILTLGGEDVRNVAHALASALSGDAQHTRVPALGHGAAT